MSVDIAMWLNIWQLFWLLILLSCFPCFSVHSRSIYFRTSSIPNICGMYTSFLSRLFEFSGWSIGYILMKQHRRHSLSISPFKIQYFVVFTLVHLIMLPHCWGLVLVFFLFIFATACHWHPSEQFHSPKSHIVMLLVLHMPCCSHWEYCWALWWFC